MTAIELVALVVDVVLGAAVSRYMSSRFRQAGANEWWKRWPDVDRAHWKRIRRTVASGQTVADPRDAELAIALANHSRAVPEILGSRVVLALELPAVIVSIAAYVATRGFVSGFLAALGVVGLVTWLFARVAKARGDARYERVRARNEHLLGYR